MLRVQSFFAAVALLAYVGDVFEPSAPKATIGFQRLRVDDYQGAPIDLAIWYPSRSRASLHRLGSIVQTVAVNGSVEGRDHPLVIIAPGDGGSFRAHHHTALSLAAAGYVVAVPSQSDRTSLPARRPSSLLDRVERISVAIDFMNADWFGASAIDADRIGVVGFSIGAVAALVASGGKPDLRRAGPSCEIDRAYSACSRMPSTAGYAPVAREPLPMPPRDRRIAAAVLVAPTLGFTFSPDGLQHVAVPVQLWRPEDDVVAPHPWHADLIRQSLPRPADYHVVANAGHYSFNSPCAEYGSTADGACPEAADSTRRDLLDALNKKLTVFLDRELRAKRG